MTIRTTLAPSLTIAARSNSIQYRHPILIRGCYKRHACKSPREGAESARTVHHLHLASPHIPSCFSSSVVLHHHQTTTSRALHETLPIDSRVSQLLHLHLPRHQHQHHITSASATSHQASPSPWRFKPPTSSSSLLQTPPFSQTTRLSTTSPPSSP